MRWGVQYVAQRSLGREEEKGRQEPGKGPHGEKNMRNAGRELTRRGFSGTVFYLVKE